MNIINDWLIKHGDKKIEEKVKLILSDVVEQSELYTCDCKVCGKPFGDKLSLYEHYDEEHN
jgi:biotin synthase-related radical SAM superfamily protein